MAIDRADRTYYLSDERLDAFRRLPAEDKLRWLEELATFLRMTRPAGRSNTDQDTQSDQSA